MPTHRYADLRTAQRLVVKVGSSSLTTPDGALDHVRLGALDAQTREVMHDLILHIHRVEKTTIVFVTHDVEEAIYLGQRVVLMQPRPGRVHSTFTVPLPAQRTQEMKHTVPFRELRAEILARIRQSTGITTDLDMLDQLNLQSTAV